MIYSLHKKMDTGEKEYGIKNNPAGEIKKCRLRVNNYIDC